MTTNKDFEKYDAFPMARVECLINDLEHVLKLSHKRKNKNKIEVLVQIAKEDMLMHLAELVVDLDKSFLTVKPLNKKSYAILTEK